MIEVTLTQAKVFPGFLSDSVDLDEKQVVEQYPLSSVAKYLLPQERHSL